MKKQLILISLTLLMFVVACGPAGDDEATTEPERDGAVIEDSGDVMPRPTITPIPQDLEAEEAEGSESEAEEGYPPPQPEAVVQPEGYPVPAALPERDAYPAAEGMAWVLLPVGKQCEEEQPYRDLKHATTTLEAEGVSVNDSTTIELMVASVCGGATSEHYRAQILVTDIEKAATLGWYTDE